MGKVENEGMPVVRLDRQLKYQGNILKIYEDTVLANGHEAHWDYIHHDGAAAVLPVTSEGKILMVRQYRNALNRYTLESWTHRMSQRSSVLTENWRRKLVSALKNWNIS